MKSQKYVDGSLRKYEYGVSVLQAVNTCDSLPAANDKLVLGPLAGHLATGEPKLYEGSCFPKVTIGMPVFNGERYIDDAITSILNQTFENFELVIQDNASTDCTAEICLKFESKDERVSYHRNNINVGAMENFNSLCASARGEYFKWAAHDDMCAQQYLERCVKELDDDPSTVLCHTLTQRIDSSGKNLDFNQECDFYIDSNGNLRSGGISLDRAQSNSPHERFSDIFRYEARCLEVFGLMRTETLQKTKLLRPNYGSDRVLLTELSLYGKFHIINEKLFFNRKHDSQSHHRSPFGREKWMNPSNRRPRRFIQSRQIMIAIIRSPLEWNEKLKCIRLVLRESSWERLLTTISKL